MARAHHFSQVRWSDQTSMSNRHRMNRPLDRLFPEGKETAQYREVWKGVVALPDEVLKESQVVRHPVDDLGGGQAVAFIYGHVDEVSWHRRFSSCRKLPDVRRLPQFFNDFKIMSTCRVPEENSLRPS